MSAATLQAPRVEYQNARMLRRFEAIKAVVAGAHGYSVAELVAPGRVQRVADARHAAMVICRLLTRAPLQDVAEAFGRKDHNSVINAILRVEEKAAADPRWGAFYRKLYLDAAAAEGDVK